MDQANLSRRVFLERSALALGAVAAPIELFGQTVLTVRPEWQQFKITPQYDSLLNAVKLMKANTNASDVNSWTYWTNIHVNKCPHSLPYFLAWHRGYIYYFERQLRAISGDSKLVLPYWDYYTYAQLPAEFTNPSTDNPLYVERVNTNVRPALSLAAFSSTVTNFQEGKQQAFEPIFESAPHNQLHNLIGNAMADMVSPNDPIFWLHHANVDRIWVSWVAAGGGRKMPALSTSYWAGNHVYTSSLSMPRKQTYSTRTTLAYRYANETMPTQLPLAQAKSDQHNPRLFRVQASMDNLPGTIPPVASFRISAPRQTSATSFALGGALNVGLNERSVSVQLPVSAEHSQVLANIAAGMPARIAGVAQTYRSAVITLDAVELSELGAKGGYFYKIYLNIPSSNRSSGDTRSIYLGTLGAFEIHAAAHHGSGGPVQLRYNIKQAVAGATVTQIGMMSLSFVRVSGSNTPSGAVIGIGEARVEAVTDDAAV